MHKSHQRFNTSFTLQQSNCVLAVHYLAFVIIVHMRHPDNMRSVSLQNKNRTPEGPRINMQTDFCSQNIILSLFTASSQAASRLSQLSLLCMQRCVRCDPIFRIYQRVPWLFAARIISDFAS